MPVSVYLRAGLFVVAVGAALFAAAGTVAIPGFWVYLAIFAAVMIVSFAALDPDLLRERMRPGGQKPPLALRLFGGYAVAIKHLGPNNEFFRGVAWPDHPDLYAVGAVGDQYGGQASASATRLND